MKEIETQTMFEEVKQKGKVIVVFSADWCPDCVVIKPILPELEKEFLDYQFFYIDRDKHIDICQELDIFGIPSFVAYHNGNEIDRFVDKNRKTKEQIAEFIRNLN